MKLVRTSWVSVLAVVLWLASAAVAQQPLVSGVRGIAITVSDMDRAVDFYSSVLDFRKISDEKLAGDATDRYKGIVGARLRIVRMQLGDELIELHQFVSRPGRPIPADSRSNDRWFQHIAIIVRDMEQAYARLLRHGVRHASPWPQLLPEWNKNAGGIEAFYFRDPDDHNLEILKFPTGKGDSKWHRPGQDLFLGIDHTAIVVANSATSLRFYHDLLGMRIAGASENYGIEQQRLNNVPGARLRITALRAATGPGIEFLEYLSPTDGRPFPPEARANDLLHWETILEVTDAESIGARIADRTISMVPQAVEKQVVLARDPDGHVIALVQTGKHTER